MFYYEQASVGGQWEPVKSPTEPEVRNGRQVRNDSTGPKIRAVQRINQGHERMTLNQLRDCYSPDGKFRMTGGKSK